VTIAHRPDAATAEAQLRRLANEASVLIGLRGSGDAWDWIVVLRIRRLLAAGASAEKHADLLEQAVRLLVAEAGEPKRRRQRR